jgi:hypothetical protein
MSTARNSALRLAVNVNRRRRSDREATTANEFGPTATTVILGTRATTTTAVMLGKTPLNADPRCGRQSGNDIALARI